MLFLLFFSSFLGANRKISYSFVNNHLGQFEINAKTGIVRLKRPLDRETESEYNLTVQATDHGSPSLSSTVLLSVTVLDVNDNPPEFTSKIIFATVSESVPVNSEIATVHATSEDIGINAEISYSIIGGDEQGFFEISPSTGIQLICLYFHVNCFSKSLFFKKSIYIVHVS